MSNICKKIKSPCHKVQDDLYLVLSPVGNMVALNESLYFIWDNCNGRKSSHDMAVKLYDLCTNKHEININQMESDIDDAIVSLLEDQLIVRV